MTQTTAARGSDVRLGIVLIVLTVFLMSVADAVIKYVSSDLPLWQVFVLRSLIVIPALSAPALFGARLKPPERAAVRWAFVRAMLLALMYICIYAAIPVLPLSTISAALYTGPLFIALLAGMISKEKARVRDWAAIAIGLAGVLVILRPNSESFTLLALIPFAAAAVYALAAVLTHARCAETSPVILALALNYALLLTGLAATAVVAAMSDQALAESYPFLFGPWIPMGPREWGIVAILAVLMVGIGLGLAKAYQSAPAPVVATFDYSYLLFAALWSWLLFDQPPDEATILGMTMIAGAGAFVVGR